MRTLGALLLLLSAAELSRSAARHNPVAHQAPVLPWTPALRAVASDPEPGRAIGVQPKQSGRFGPWVIGSNLFQAYGIADAGAYHSLLPARLARYHTVMARLAEGAAPADALQGGRSFFVTLEHYDFRATALARLMGIRYLFYRPSDDAPSAQGLRAAYQGEVDVYRFTGHLPRAFVAPAFEVEPDPERLLARLADPGFRPRQTVLLEEPPSVTAGGGESSAMLASSGPESSTYEVKSAAGGLLVVTDAMYPGWTVRVNGTPAHLLRADYLFRAVAVPPGTSTVDMRYEPRSFRAGVAVSLISGALVLALGFALARRAQGPTP